MLLTSLIACCMQGDPVPEQSSRSAGWIERPIEQWPRLVLSQSASFRISSDLTSGCAFLGERPDGRVVAVTANALLSVRAGVIPAVRVPELSLQWVAWNLRAPGLDDPAVALSGLASAGFDHWTCGLLMFDLESAPPPGFATPLALGDAPPEPGAALTLLGPAAGAGEPQPALRVIAGPVDEAGGFEFTIPEGTAEAWAERLGAPLIDSQARAVGVLTGLVSDPQGERFLGQAQAPARLLGAPPALVGKPVPPLLPPASLASTSASQRVLALAAPPVGRAQLFTLPSLSPWPRPDALGRATAVAFSPEGNSLFAWDRGRVRWLDLLSGEELISFPAPLENASAIGVSPDRKHLIVGTRFAPRALQFDLARETLVREYQRPVNDLAFTPDGNAVLLAGDGGSIQLIDLASGAVLRNYEGLEGVVWSVALDPSGQRLAAGCEAGRLCVYDIGDPTPVRTLHSGSGGVKDVAFARDGALLIAATGSSFEDDEGAYDLDCYVRVFDASSGVELARSHDHERFVELCVPLPGTDEVLGLTANAEAWIWQLPFDPSSPPVPLPPTVDSPTDR